MNLQDVDPKQLLLALRQASRELKSESFSPIQTPFGFSQLFDGYQGEICKSIPVTAYVDMWPQRLILSSSHLDCFWVDYVTAGPKAQTTGRIHAPLWEKLGPSHFDTLFCGQSLILQVSYVPPKEKYETEEWEWVRHKRRKKHVVKKVTKERGISATLSGVLLCRLRESSFTDE